MATILVADDDQLLRAIIRDHLERADHEVLEAGDGIAALDIALEERPEVLLLDVMMPLARGLEVVRRVRREDAWHPVIAMISARTRVTDRLNALEAGADAYFEKPFEPDALLETIERLLSDVPPARYVDVLGPVWMGLAVERLTRDAIERHVDPVGRERVEATFHELVARTVGRDTNEARRRIAPSPDALRLLWEDAIRGLLSEMSEPVPVSTDVTAPDILGAVERAIGDETLVRHRAQLGGATGLDGFWDEQLRTVFGDATRAAGSPRDVSPPNPWTTRLRSVLDSDGPSDGDVARWTGVLEGLMGRPPEHSALDPLQRVWLAIAEQSLIARVRA